MAPRKRTLDSLLIETVGRLEEDLDEAREARNQAISEKDRLESRVYDLANAVKFLRRLGDIPRHDC